MSKKKEDIARLIVELVKDSKKDKRIKWPVGEPESPTAPARIKWPVGEPKGIRPESGDRWPVGVVLPTKPERDMLSMKIMKNLGVEVKIQKSTRFDDLTATIHSLMNIKK